MCRKLGPPDGIKRDTSQPAITPCISIELPVCRIYLYIYICRRTFCTIVLVDATSRKWQMFEEKKTTVSASDALANRLSQITSFPSTSVCHNLDLTTSFRSSFVLPSSAVSASGDRSV